MDMVGRNQAPCLAMFSTGGGGIGLPMLGGDWCFLHSKQYVQYVDPGSVVRTAHGPQ